MKKGYFFIDDKEEDKEIENEEKWFVNYLLEIFFIKKFIFFYLKVFFKIN